MSTTSPSRSLPPLRALVPLLLLAVLAAAPIVAEPPPDRTLWSPDEGVRRVQEARMPWQLPARVPEESGQRRGGGEASGGGGPALPATTPAVAATAPVGTAPPAEAAPPEPGGEPVPMAGSMRVNDDGGPAEQSRPAIAYATVQEYLVVWTDGRDALEGRGLEIYGQRLARSGAPLGANFRVSGLAATGDEDQPAVAWNRNRREYLVVWVDGRRFDEAGRSIYGQRVSAGGRLVGRNFRISGGPGSADQVTPAVAYDVHADEYLVVWEDDREVEGRVTGSDLWAQRLAGDGRRLGNNFFVGGERGVSGDRFPRVVFNPLRDEYLVVWTVTIPLRPLSAVLARRVSAGGELLGDEIEVRSDSVQRVADVAHDLPNDRYLVVWEDDRVDDRRGRDVFGRLLAGDGTPTGEDFRISAGSGADELRPAAAHDRASASFVVAWTDTRRSAGEPFVQRLDDAGGERRGLNLRVSDADADRRDGQPAIATAPAFAELLVAWTDEREADAFGADVRAQVLTLPD